MTEELKDTIGEIFWFAMFFAPVIAVILVWKYIEIEKFYRIIIGIIIGLFISLICYYVSMGILFRNGMGPG